MPYIEQKERDQIDPLLKKLLMHMGPLTPGQFVYIMYQIALWQATNGGVDDLPINWTKCNEIMGNIDCAGKEFYRQIVGPYEDNAVIKNGDCEPYRANRRPFTRVWRAPERSSMWRAPERSSILVDDSEQPEPMLEPYDTPREF